MRLWSIHPQYLDTKGLLALWREALLAKHVLEGKTKGYKNHPQLNRFKTQDNPNDAINQYLSEVYFEALKRNYDFKRDKINWSFTPVTISVTFGQITYERSHLLNKLKIRDIEKYTQFQSDIVFDQHPLFYCINGDIEPWEVVK